MVEGEGFEPSKAKPAELQSAPFDRSGIPPDVLYVLGPFDHIAYDAYSNRPLPTRMARHSRDAPYYCQPLFGGQALFNKRPLPKNQ